MDAIILLTDFTKGEISPKYYGRVDKQFYYQGAKTLQDLIVLPQGGVTRTPGTYYIAAITSGSGSDDVVRLYNYTPQSGYNYLLVFKHQAVDIYKDGTLKASVTTSYDGHELDELQFCPVDTSLIITHGSHQPMALDWTNDTTWALTNYWGTYFSTTHPYPKAVTYHEGRLIFGGTTDRPNSVFGSQVGDSTNFVLGTNPADPWEYNVAAGGIKWLISANYLVIGSGQSEYIMSGRGGGAITPNIGNVIVHKQSDFGSELKEALLIDGSVLFVQHGGRIIRGFAYNSQQAAYQSADLTFLSEHLFTDGIKEMAYQRVPNNLLWVVTDTGTLLTFNYSPVYGLAAWTEQSFNGTVESVAVVKGSTEDEVYISVIRTINGSTVRHIEKFAPFYIADRDDYHYVRDGISATPSGTTVSGLSHLEGETVDVVVDGLTQTQKTVSSGEITLDSTGSVAHVGLPYTPTITTLPINTGQLASRITARIKSVIDLKVLFNNTPGATVYNSDDVSNAMEITLDDVPSGGTEPLFSGWKKILFPDMWDRYGYITIKSVNPQPFTVLSIIADVEVH